MTITAKVIADSISFECPRLTTLELRYPRFIHSEFMTHRKFSRNSSSSRAIPVEKLVYDVMNDPAMPIHWGENQKGMQARGELTSAEYEWLVARDDAVRNVFTMHSMGYHKQIVNRLIEPFAHINVLCTGTHDAYRGFFHLRDHPDAQPEIQALAKAMKAAMGESYPEVVDPGEWHMPYTNGVTPYESAMKVSVARCASVSYKTVDGKEMTLEKALEIYDKLAGSDPQHLSPFEHVATPCMSGGSRFCRNFDRWKQYRSVIEGVQWTK